MVEIKPKDKPDLKGMRIQQEKNEIQVVCQDCEKVVGRKNVESGKDMNAQVYYFVGCGVESHVYPKGRFTFDKLRGVRKFR